MDLLNGRREKKVFKWIISSLDKHPGGEFDSVMFSAGNPCHSLCYLKLFHVIKEGKRTLSYKLCFLKGSYQRGYTCKVSLLDKDGKTKQLPLFNPSRVNLLFLEDNFIPLGTVTLRCMFTFPKVSCEHMASVTDLSKTISSLRKMKESFDLVLYNGEKEIFVHKDILQQRCFELLEYFGIKGEEKYKVVDISTPVLEAILHYVYSGQFKAPSEEHMQEFFEIAEMCLFEEFKYEIIQLQLPATLCTDIKAITKKIYWKIGVRNALLGEVPLFKQVNLDSIRFFVKVSINKTNRGISVDTSIRCGSTVEDPILLDCTTSIAVDRNDLESLPEVKLLFLPEDKENEKHLSTYFYNKKLQRESNLLMLFSIASSKGENTCFVEDLDLQLKAYLCTDLPSIFGMGLLSCDLCDINGKMIIYLRDGKICEQTDKSATTIISSAMAHYYIAKDSDADEVKISSIYNGKGKRQSMACSGTYTAKGCEYDLRFYNSVGRFQISHSVKKLSSLLARHLTESNACDMLVQADRRNNESVKKAVAKYIRLNRSVILNSSQWTSLVRTHRELTSKVLQDVSGEWYL